MLGVEAKKNGVSSSEENIFSWPLTTRHHVPVDKIVALIVFNKDERYTQIARVNYLQKTERQEIVEGRTVHEPCLSVHLIFPSGDHGAWLMPLANERYQGRDFHPVPRYFYRTIDENDSAYWIAESHGVDLHRFWRECKTLRNGTSEKIHEEYKALFGEEFPLR